MDNQIIRIGDVVQFTDDTEYNGCLGIVRDRLTISAETKLAVVIPLPSNRIITILASATNHEIKRIGTAIVPAKKEKQMKRITIKRGNKWLIPRLKISEASARLAEYEDTGITPDKLLEMDRLYVEKCADLGNAHARLDGIKEQVMAIIDDVDGQVTDDPVSEIRDRLESLPW